MKLPMPIIFCLLISACSSYKPNFNKPSDTNTERTPSSELKEESYAKSFEILMSNENPDVEFAEYLKRLKSIFARSEAYLSDFDKEIDDAVSTGNSVNFDSSKSYKKLLVMRNLSERMQDKMTYFYLKLTDMSYDKSQSVSQRKLAKKILKTFKLQLESSNPLEKISFDDLKTHIANAIKMRRGIGNKSINTADMPQNNFNDEQEKLNLLRKNRESFRNIGRSEHDKDTSFSKQLENDTDNIQLVDQQTTGREPQSEKKFYPSTGPNGNVMGMIFKQGVWALTYDDGPSPIHTPVIVKNLKELGINATFFWLAQNVVQNQSIVDLVKANGNALANHSWSHAQLPKISEEALDKEITKSTEVETKAYGMPVKFFRCPYGAGNSVLRIRQRIADLGMIHVFWNVDTLDWQDKDPDSIVERAKKQMIANGHGVVLFHDIHAQSVIASKKLVQWSQTFKGTDKEMRWVTLPGIVNEMNGE